MKLRKIKNLGEGMVLVIDDNRVKHIIRNYKEKGKIELSE